MAAESVDWPRALTSAGGDAAYAQLHPDRISSAIGASPSYISTLNHDLGNFVHVPLWISNGGIDPNPGPSQVNTFVTAFIGAPVLIWAVRRYGAMSL